MFFFKKLSLLLMYSGKKKQIYKKVLKGFPKTACITSIIYRLKPIMETHKVRKGSKIYEIPFFLKKNRAFGLLLRWLVQAIRKKKKPLLTTLQHEFQDLISFASKESKALHVKITTNIIYSHFRWR